MISLRGAASQLSVAMTATVTGTNRWFGGQSDATLGTRWMMAGGSVSRRYFARAWRPMAAPISPATTVELRQWNPAAIRARLESPGKSEKRA